MNLWICMFLYVLKSCLSTFTLNTFLFWLTFFFLLTVSERVLHTCRCAHSFKDSALLDVPDRPCISTELLINALVSARPSRRGNANAVTSQTAVSSAAILLVYGLVSNSLMLRISMGVCAALKLLLNVAETGAWKSRTPNSLHNRIRKGCKWESCIIKSCKQKSLKSQVHKAWSGLLFIIYWVPNPL